MRQVVTGIFILVSLLSRPAQFILNKIGDALQQPLARERQVTIVHPAVQINLTTSTSSANRVTSTSPQSSAADSAPPEVTKKSAKSKTRPAVQFTPPPQNVVAPTSIPIAPPAPLSTLPESAIYAKLDTAVVQILCDIGNNLFVSGSGAVISPDGIVLTNAHVVQDSKTCVVKTGDPALPAGELKILYKGDITKKITGTEVSGEDFAFGKITTIYPHSRLQKPFKFLSLRAVTILAKSQFYLAAYASEFIGGLAIQSNQQNLVFAMTRASNLYYVYDHDVLPGILELTGNAATQEGASGSPVISPEDGSVIALVFGQDKGAPAIGQVLETAKRFEFAFLVSHLDRVIQNKEGMTLQEFVNQLGARQ